MGAGTNIPFQPFHFADIKMKFIKAGYTGSFIPEIKQTFQCFIFR